mmetsp:Transcript_81981/g.228511  ORF Transcript_81981/g.228511 Transcript_81981/m.228511 type:complete len:376 (+) Transcript_81981:85-1212(+)|eukprot:CAMPEP_0117536942 /NCGR_PEP_ID=MMETSP0784-20121206/41710_1 /TAXON_ID=39447 /ORGANISM="" /LENGTH=375 /DNA_ID=CAMNT_0005333515 /DNA_START=79 /DNA_END=1206 /DNA_ORIENTATION=+
MSGWVIALKNEARAYYVVAKLVWKMVTDRVAYSKVTLSQYIGSILQLVHEALTNNGQSCEEVCERMCGKGNYTALNGKVAIITGASNGLGLENARVLMKYGCHVVWAVRNPEKAKKALEDLESKGGRLAGEATVLKVDLSDLTTVKPFVDGFLRLRLPLHFLILNAGIMAPLRWEPSKQGYESMFATNNLGHYLMTELLLPKLEETAKSKDVGDLGVRIVILSSAAGSMCSGMDLKEVPVSKEHYHEIFDYSVTKAIGIFYARFLQGKYRGQNIYAVAVHPGVVGTGLLSHNPGLGYLFYDSITFTPLRKGIPSGSATTMYCTLSSDVPAQVKEGSVFYYNRGPQKVLGIAKPGVADHLVKELDVLQKKLVQPYM